MENAKETVTTAEAVEVKTEAKQPKKEKLFPVKLLKNYRPVSSAARIKDDQTGEDRPLNEEESQKVLAGQNIFLPVDEAKTVISSKIAERNDAIA